ncbi:MAG TPA: ABC transporter permease [Gemmatimonadaceae bacterium]|nr:ABC transporter permease [Gemmatimonadaceae bacterium]
MTWLRRVLHRQRIYDDLSDEIRAHLDEKADELIAQGMSPAAARDAARRAFGNVTRVQEDGRESWQWPTIESFLMDVRYALRQLRRAPALSAIIVATLAIGIAATTTVFSWTQSVLLDPLPGAGEPGRVMALETTTASGSWTPTSWLDYIDFRKYLKSFDGLAAAYPTSLAIGDEAHTERRWGELVSANFFDVLRVRPALGGFFPSSVDEAPGAQPAVVIGYDLWQSRWHGDSAVIGSVVRINRFPFTIVGVAPAAFHGSMPGERIQIWVPAAMLGQIVPTGGWWLRDRGTRTFRVLARLGPGVTFGAARSEVESFAAVMAKANGDVSKGMGGRLMPLWQSHWGVQDALRAPLVVLLAACGLVLLIVCANAANLLLARATGRRRELGLRLALGAPRRRLLRQLLTEASVLAVTGSALGLLCTVWLAHSLRWLVPSFAAPSLLDPHVDAGVLAFTAVLAASVTLLAGIAPALHGSREALGDALNDGARGAAGSVHATFIRALLVASEMALAVIALVGAGLFYDSFRHTRAVSPGFDADHVAMASVSITLAGYDSAHGETFLRDVAERIRREPGVSAVSYTDYVPLSLGSGSWEDVRVEGYAPQPSENMKLFRAAIGPDYFAVLGIPLVAGREFTLDDDSAHTAVMIVNEAFVRHFLDGRAALGVRIHGWGRWFTIVGVSKDVKNYRLTEPPTPYFYVPVRQVYRPEYGYTFLARTEVPVDQTVRTIAQAVRSTDPTVPVFNSMRLTDYIEGPLQGQQAATRLLAILAGVASLLAAIGLYGVIAYAVAQQTKEIGVRIALGAQRSDVLRMVARQAGALLTVGLIAGLGGALALARLVSSMLYSVGAGDVAVFAAAAATMVAIALVATSVPARRAMNVDPLVALRAE